MVKGCQRKIYYLKNTGSKYFEEAYLVLKREENGKAQASQTELSREAERIIKEALFVTRNYKICGKFLHSMIYAPK